MSKEKKTEITEAKYYARLAQEETLENVLKSIENEGLVGLKERIEESLDEVRGIVKILGLELDKKEKENE